MHPACDFPSPSPSEQIDPQPCLPASSTLQCHLCLYCFHYVAACNHHFTPWISSEPWHVPLAIASNLPASPSSPSASSLLLLPTTVIQDDPPHPLWCQPSRVEWALLSLNPAVDSAPRTAASLHLQEQQNRDTEAPALQLCSQRPSETSGQSAQASSRSP